MTMKEYSERPSRHSVISTGITTIVLIFTLLCLLTFSVLSLVSARANMRLSKKSADRTTAYYQAENRANDILIKVDDCIRDLQDIREETVFLTELRKSLEGKDSISFTDDRTLTWTVPLAEKQYLKAEIRVSQTPLKNGTHYEILSWNTGTDYEWGSEEPLPLLESSSVPDMTTEE